MPPAQRSSHTNRAYLLTVAAVLVALLSRSLLDPLLGDHLPFVTFFVATIFAAYVGGLRAALLSTALGFVAALYLFVPPRASVLGTAEPDLIGFVLYFVVSIAIATLAGAMWSARRGAATQAETLRVTLASIGDAVICTDTLRRITFMNDVAERLTGWANQEAIGRDLSDIFVIVNEETRQTVDNPVEKALRMGHAVGLANHTVLISRNGTEYHIDDSAAPIRESAGPITGVVLVFHDISERRRAEVAERDAQQQLTSTLGSITDGFMRFDRDWRIVYINDEAERIIGAERATVMGRSQWQLWPATVGTALEREYRRAVADRVTIEIEDFFEPWLRWFVIKGFPTPDGGLAIYFHDITQRKQDEARQRYQAEILELIAQGQPLDTVLPAICRAVEEQATGARCLILIPNEAGSEVRYAFGGALPASYLRAIEGQPMGEPVQVDDIASDSRWPAHLRELSAQHGLRSCRPIPVHGRGGSVLASFALLGLESDAPAVLDSALAAMATRLAGIAIDHHLVDERRRASDTQFRQLADAMPQIVYVSDGDGQVVFVNRQWREYTGQPDAQTADLAAFVHEEDLALMLERWQQARAGQHAFESEFRLRHHGDGHYRWFLTRAVPERDERGRIVRWFGTSTDINDVKVAERRKDEFLATLAHELRNPLAPIRSALAIMDVAADDDAAARARALIGRQVDVLVRLVDDLIDVSRISRGKLELRRQRCALAQVIDSAVETSRPLVTARTQQLTIELPPEPIAIDGDPVRLSQIFANLLNNAAKFTPPHGAIAIRVGHEAGVATIRVVDNGIGLPADRLPDVFEMFTQIDQSFERSAGGLGIGLSLVRELVRAHGGKVDVTSDGPGRGATFTVTLPVLEAVDDPDPRQEVPASTNRPRRILVADDNADAAEMMAMLLRHSGHEVKTANDGEEALAIAADFEPDIAMLDIGMPRLNGYDTARQLRERHGPRLMLIALTGWGQDEHRQRSREAGFDHHLVKPVAPDTLAELLSGIHADSSQFAEGPS